MRLLVIGVIIVLAGCGGRERPHYVLCEETDGRGWDLIDTEYDGGFLIACTYQSPDRQQIQTSRCNSDGCD